MTFFGRPPFAPLARAAAVLASDVTLPPRRPNATAAGFLRATGQRLVAFSGRAQFVSGVAVDPAAGAFGFRLHLAQAGSVLCVLALQCVLWEGAEEGRQRGVFGVRHAAN